jgi:hypothetical protein
MRLEGYKAIKYAEAHGLNLEKYTDPTEEARQDITPEEARGIAKEDPSLIFLDADALTYHCQCGEVFGESCAWAGPASELVLIGWMPEYLRDAHAAARNSGSYPANGMLRLAVERTCADRIEDAEGMPEGWPAGCVWVERPEVDNVLDYAELMPEVSRG